MLGVGIQQVGKGIVVRHRRIDIRKGDHEHQQAQDHNVDLLPEKYPEDALPVGVPGSRDLLRLQIVVVRKGEQLRLAQTQLLIIIFHHTYLALLVKEIRGSTVAISTSPRMMDTTDSTA